MIVDTSVLLAFFNKGEPRHDDAVAALNTGRGSPLVVSPYVLAELDYLVATRVGVDAELAVLRELTGGAWELAQFGAPDVESATALIEKYADQQIGLADASLVVLAHRYGVRTIATLDRRHFTALRPVAGGRFSLVP
ncbi:MAG TPA: PIN domain-containing protein [Cryptosporangiaceae bacterium]|nr:PIN domain-containing protein [Cryptosporangiaceae bacterium]